MGRLHARWTAAASLALAALSAPASTQDWPGQPPIGADVTAAVAGARNGDAGPLRRLADADRADAQFYLGALHIYGVGAIPKDGVKGCALLEKASATRADAMHLLGECYQFGFGGQKDEDRAMATFERAAAMGLAKSNCALGNMLLVGRDPARGLELCKRGADAGDADAQADVGNIYLLGRVVARDPAEARRWYQLAAAQRQRQASRTLGEMYARGDGGPKDMKEAVRLWTVAAEAGDPYAPALLADRLFMEISGGSLPGAGTFGRRGRFPMAKIQEAMRWYQLALERDDREQVRNRASIGLVTLEALRRSQTQ